MALFFETGNLGADPELKTVKVDGRETAVVNMRVKFDRPKKVSEGQYEDQGGYWADVALWGGRAKHIANLYEKGNRVGVIGELFTESYEKDGEEKIAIKVIADQIMPDPIRIEAITWRSKSSSDTVEGHVEEQAVA